MSIPIRTRALDAAAGLYVCAMELERRGDTGTVSKAIREIEQSGIVSLDEVKDRIQQRLQAISSETGREATIDEWPVQIRHG